MKIKACEIKPGMVIKIKFRKNFKEVCLVTAVSGYTEVEYEHITYNSFYGNLTIGTLEGKKKVKVITGRKRKFVIEQIRNDVFKHYFDTKQIIDTLNLIQAMDK